MLGSTAGTAALIAALTGGVVAAFVTSVIGPLIADRQARHERYRDWQRKLGTDVL